MKAQNEALKSSEEELRAQQEEMLQKNQLLETQSKRLKASHYSNRGESRGTATSQSL